MKWKKLLFLMLSGGCFSNTAVVSLWNELRAGHVHVEGGERRAIRLN